MIDGVANHVRQRILDRFDNRLVELRFFSFHLDAHLLRRTTWPRRARVRGNLLQILPIGCMRVFITPSCSSVVIRFRRWLWRKNPGVFRGVEFAESGCAPAPVRRPGSSACPADPHPRGWLRRPRCPGPLVVLAPTPTFFAAVFSLGFPATSADSGSRHFVQSNWLRIQL